MAAFRDGDICHFCRRPMYRTQRLDLDHTPDRRSFRGLTHASCNRRDGAIRGNRMRQPQQPRHSRIW